LSAAQRRQGQRAPGSVRRSLRENDGAVPRRPEHEHGDVRVGRHRALPRHDVRAVARWTASRPSMLFHRAPFLWLLGATFVAHWWMLRTRRARNLLLLAASVVFYAHWNPWLVPLVAGTALYDYRMALAIEAAPGERARRRLLVAAVAVPLGLLAFFKYTNFLVAQAWWPLRALGVQAPPPIFDIVLPLGISFYTFETIAYVVDVYRRRLPAERHPLDYALFLLFF